MPNEQELKEIAKNVEKFKKRCDALYQQIVIQSVASGFSADELSTACGKIVVEGMRSGQVDLIVGAQVAQAIANTVKEKLAERAQQSASADKLEEVIVKP